MQELKKLFFYLKPFKKWVSISVFCHVMMAVFTVISIPMIIPFFHFLFSTTPSTDIQPSGALDIVGWLQYFFIKIIDTYGPNKTLVLTCVFLLVTIFLKNLFRYLAMYFMVPVRSGVAFDLRSQLYSSYINMSFDVQKDTNRGDLITRLNNDVNEIEWNVLRFIDTIFKSPIIIFGAIALMLSISVKMTLFVFLLMLFTGLVIGTLSRRLKKQSEELQNQMSQITNHLDYTLDGGFILKVYRSVTEWKNKFLSINNNVRTLFNSVVRRQELSSPLSEFLGVGVVVVLLWYGARSVMKGEIEPATFFAFVLAFYHVIEPLKSFSTAYYYIKKGAASMERIDNVLQRKNDLSFKANREFVFNEKIEFINVSAQYEDQAILNDISFEIKKGQKIALVGASGSGKSTIVRLLLNVIPVKGGEIRFDGVLVNEFDEKDIYSHIGFVTQSSFIYNDTIRNNILLGRKGISDEKIIQCLHLACAWEFVSKIDGQLDAWLSERGKNLSGGEKQRLTIARALVEDPQILIFDEPTSALDPQSEKMVSQAITNVLKDRTAIIIAHRLSTIKNVDNIFVIENGILVEKGNHTELSQGSGLYSKYVKIQSVDVN